MTAIEKASHRPLHLKTTRQNLIDLIAGDGSEKAKQEIRKLFATIDVKLSCLSDETDISG